MNKNRIRHKNETEDLLLSITKNCETLNKQTHRKAEETLEFKMIQSTQTFPFKPPVPIKGFWMIGLKDLEIYKSMFNITEINKKFGLFNFRDENIGGISYAKVRDEIVKDLNDSDITATDLQDDIIGPIFIEEYRGQVTKRKEDAGYMNILSVYPRSVFQDFESYLRTEIDLVEDDIGVVLDKYNSRFITYALDPGNYTFKDISEALFNILQPFYPEPSNVNVIEYDDITRKTKLVVKNGTIAIRFEEKLFFSTALGFNPSWDYEHYNEYTSQKIVNSSTTNKIPLKSDVIDGSVLKRIREPILFSFVSDRLLGYKVFCEPETIHYKEINNSVLNTIVF